MSLYSWKQLAWWSLEYSCLLPKEQARGRSILDASWKKFCQQVVDTYGSLMKAGGEEIDEDKAKEAYPERRADT
jgi:adenosine deaminase CECR1